MQIFPMKTSPLIVAGILAASLSMARATSVTFGGAPTARLVQNSNLTTVTTPGLVWAGTFSAANAFSLNSGLSLAANVAAVMSSGGWHQFTLDPSTGSPYTDSAQIANTTNTLIVSSSGKVGGQVTDNNGTPGSTDGASFFDSKPIYLWIFNGTSVGSSTEMGIYRAAPATPSWTFKNNANGVGDDITLSSTSSGATVAAIGGFGSASSSQFVLTGNFNVVPVPEPGTLAIGLFAGMVGICVRRRKVSRSIAEAFKKS